MRLMSRDVAGVVGVAPAGSQRPVRMRFGALTYALTNDEAITLATKLVDIVAELRALERKHKDV